MRPSIATTLLVCFALFLLPGFTAGQAGPLAERTTAVTRYHSAPEKVFGESGGNPTEKSVWREINLEDNLNVPFAYSGKHLFSVLKEAAFSRKVPIYAPNDYQKTNRYTDTMAVSDLWKLITKTDTLARMDEWGNPIEDDPLTPGDEEFEIKTVEAPLQDMHKYLIEEVWSYDPAAKSWNVRLESIVQMIDEHWFDIEKSNKVPLFTMPFAQLWDYLARFDAPSTNNVVEVLTWADFFRMRLYRGKIITRS